MAKLTDLTANTSVDNADLMLTLDVSDTSMAATGTDKKITWANVLASIKTYTDTLYATLSSLSSYVPYSGATTNVDLGTNTLAAQSLTATGTAGNGHIYLKHQSSDATATGSSTAIFADSNGDFKYKNAGNYYTTLKTSTNTADRIYTYPDKAGTLAMTNDKLSAFAATTSAELAGVISDETGSGALVFANSPTLVTPALGTPSSVNLTNGTSLPVSGITSSTVTALGVGSLEIGHASDTTLARVSAGVASIEGKNIALNGTGETLTTGTIELGNASDTTLSRSSAGVLAVEGVVVPTISSTNTLTNKRITKRVGTTTSSATPTINTDNVDYYSLTAQTVDITSFTTNLSGTPTDAQTLWISITGTAARAITWGSSFEASTVALPTTTVSTNRLDVGFIWNAATSKWRCIATS